MSLLALLKRPRTGALALKSPADFAFEAQRPLVESDNDHDIAVIPRQAGKTTAAALRSIRVAKKPPAERVTYVTKTRQNAERIFWRELLKQAKKCGLPLDPAHVNLSKLQLRVDHEDGTYCIIELLGLHDLDQVELLRGTQYDLIIVDEAGFIRQKILENFLTEVVEPGLMARGGAVLLIGTPGPLRLGSFYDAFHKGTWGTFRWTAYQNPWLPPGAVDKAIKNLGLSETDPRFIREFKGEWADGGEEMVWAYVAGPANDVDVLLPTCRDDKGFEHWAYSWGIDLASSLDKDAIVVLGWNRRDPQRRLYVVDTWEAPGTEIVDELEAACKAMRAKWRPSFAGGDTAGHGAKKIINTLAAKLGIIFAPKPTDVEATVRLINTDFRTGRFRVARGSSIAQDMAQEIWEVNPRTGRREIGGVHSDLTAAMRYAYAAAQHQWSRGEPEIEKDPEALAMQRIDAQVAARVAATKPRRGRLRRIANAVREWLDDVFSGNRPAFA